MPELLVHALVTFLVVTDPVGLAPLFAAMTRRRSAAERRRIALKGTGVATVTLFFFALVGERFLQTLGIGIHAFRIAGGALLFLVAIDMVLARQTGLRSITTGEDEEAAHRDDISVFPLGIPLMAGPGAIASVMLMMGRAEGDFALQAGVLAVLLAVLVSALALLLIAPRVLALFGVTGVNVIGRVLGIVLAALAVQFVLDGITGAFPGIPRTG